MKLNATLDDDALRSHILFNSDALARWESQLDIKVTPDRSLSGYVNIEKINLQLLGQFMPQLETIEGLLGANLKLDGSLNNPELSGQLNLRDGAWPVQSTPLDWSRYHWIWPLLAKPPSSRASG